MLAKTACCLDARVPGRWLRTEPRGAPFEGISRVDGRPTARSGAEGAVLKEKQVLGAAADAQGYTKSQSIRSREIAAAR